MTAQRLPARITIYSGTFASQPLAFARLLDAAERCGTFLDLDNVDVIRHAPEVRLAHYFPPATVAAIEELQGKDDTLILLKPGRRAGSPGVRIKDTMLRCLGIFDGEIVQPTAKGEWI